MLQMISGKRALVARSPTWVNKTATSTKCPMRGDIANGTSEDTNDNGIPDECDSECSGDVDNDGDTDVDDILEIINGFGTTYDVDDLLNSIADFGCGG